MWLRRDEFNGKLKDEEIVDWVVIDGTVWIEIPDAKGGRCVQSSIKRNPDKNIIPVEACLEEGND